MQILIHPNVDTILDMRTSDNTILEFNSKFVALADKFVDDLLDRGFSG